MALALLALTISGAALRLHAAAHPGSFLSADERAYASLATSVATHGDYGTGVLEHPFHWAPGAPVLFAASDKLLDVDAGASAAQHLRTVPFAQALVGTALIPVTFALAFLLGGEIAGLLAAMAVAFYPPYITITGDLVSEPLGAVTLTAAVTVAVLAWREPHWTRTALAGAAMGVAILTRADLLVLAPLLTIAMFVRVRRDGRPLRAAATTASSYLVGALLLLAPWSIYATETTGRFVPVTEGGSSTLYVATYLPGNGTMYGLKRDLADEVRRTHPAAAHLDDDQIPAQWALDVVARGDGDHSQSRESIMTEGVLHNLRRYALGHPLSYAAMSARKLERLWLGYDRGTHHRSRTSLLVVHLVLLGVALLGLMRGIHRREPELLLVAGILTIGTLVNAVFVAEARHNARLLPLLLASGAAGWACWPRSLQGAVSRVTNWS